MNETYLFSTLDPRGYTVHLSEKQYTEHIVGESGHTEVPASDIKKAIESPTAIYASSKFPDTDVYFSKTSSIYPPLYVKVAVNIFDNDKTGDVRTSFLSKSISGAIDVRRLKYLEINNKL